MRFAALLLACGLTACGYSHIDETHSTFQRNGGALQLTVYRHLDTVISGPDMEEEQRLVLELNSFKVGQRMAVPSAEATARFDVQRFGPSSEGTVFSGYVIVKSVKEKEVVVDLHLDVSARTTTGSHKQHVKYRGDHTFFRDRRGN